MKMFQSIMLTITLCCLASTEDPLCGIATRPATQPSTRPSSGADAIASRSREYLPSETGAELVVDVDPKRVLHLPDRCTITVDYGPATFWWDERYTLRIELAGDSAACQATVRDAALLGAADRGDDLAISPGL